MGVNKLTPFLWFDYQLEDAMAFYVGIFPDAEIIDSSKFGLSALLSIARPEELDAVVVDDGLAPDIIDAYHAAGVNLVLADGQRKASFVA